MSIDPSTVTELRQQIDAIDSEMLQLLNQRAQLALRLRQIKLQQGLPIYDPDREAVVLERLETLNQGPLNANAIRNIFDQVVTGTRELLLSQDGEPFEDGA
jgi:chorismate mutase-like protein